jgi:DNA-binding SARP family transcriptional activator/tetratricopeptide (TPR) repeat protein
MVSGMDFCLLGPLVVSSGGVVVPVRRGKQRAVLAALLLSGGTAVSLGELAETLWGLGPPPSARVTIQNYVMRLRQALGPVGGSRISTQPHGYSILIDPGELDVARFESLLSVARAAARDSSWDTAAAQSRAALSLWRGEPLSDVDSEVLAAREVPRLAELRLQALEVRIEADLRLGRQAEVIAELRQLVTAHPLRERLPGLLMLALYRDGRQAEALAAYRDARKLLVEELGAEPGMDLRELHKRMLASDPALAVPGPVPPAAGAAVPRELPAGVAHFAGRTSELAALDALLGSPIDQMPGTVVISAIGGTAGVGKTALALHWAHQVAGRFGDGQLYVNLRGFDPSGIPVTAVGAIRGFLDALGIPPERIPASPEAQAGLYRSLLSGKRMLIVLDNARNEQHARPLLPASTASLVIVTSRSRLGTARAAAEAAAVDQIAILCACLPMALAVAAARAAARPGFPLSALAAELLDAAGRLDTLDAGDPAASVRAVFSWSYQQLSPDTARMFRLLGLHPGPDIAVPAAASLARTTQLEARRMLGELAHGCLIAEHVPGRYAVHDLLRAYAVEQAHHADSDTGRHEAISRVLDYYLHTAAGAARLINPSMAPVVLTPPTPGAAAEQPADRRQAMAWFEAEHQVLLALLAAGSGSDTHAWQLPWTMAPFLQARGHWQEWAATRRAALAAATRLGDTAAQALCGRLLANAYTDLGDLDQARGHYASSLTLYQRLGDRLGEAKVQHSLSVLAGHQGRQADALGHAEQALRLSQAIGDQASEADALNNVGWYHAMLGNYQQARAFCRQALTLSAQTGHRWVEGSAWDSLGYAEHHLGNLGEAAACYQRALSLHRQTGDRFYEAEALTHLGDTRHAGGERAQAREAWQQALAILDDLHHPDADAVRAKLASINDHTSQDPSLRTSRGN